MHLGGQPATTVPESLIGRVEDPVLFVGPAGSTTRAGSMLVGAGGRTVHAYLPDHLPDHIGAGMGVHQDPVPGPIPPPAVEPIRAGLPWPIPFRQVAPRRAGAQLPQDTVDDRAMIPPLAATLTARWEQGRYCAPRFLRQFPSSHHSAPPFCLALNEGSTSQLIRQTDPSGANWDELFPLRCRRLARHVTGEREEVARDPAIPRTLAECGCCGRSGGCRTRRDWLRLFGPGSLASYATMP